MMLNNKFRLIAIFFITTLLAILTSNEIKAAPPTNFQYQLVVGSGLNGPSGFGIAPDGRIFILERTGVIKVYKNGQLLEQPFTTLTSAATGDRGLIGIAFDPQFHINHWVYFYYTAMDELNYLVRFDASQDIAQTGPHVLYHTTTPSKQLHVGGSIAFGPDGKLYFAVGDNGYPPNAQLLDNPHGKILRINKDGTIPADNPFSSNPNAVPEIWAYGFRNPWRFQFDPVTGQMFGGDVGDAAWEEVNHIVRGGNYGWPTTEGACTNCSFINPIYSYHHDGLSSAVTGGFVYRGTAFPEEYQGAFFFSDYARGFIRYIQMDQHLHGDNSTHVHVNNVADFDPNAGPVVDLKQGPDGSFYYLTYYPGHLYRVSYATDNHIPVANATSNVNKGIQPLTVNFSSTGSYDPDGDPVSYQWTFGDGNSSTQANPTHTYTTPGTYTVNLNVSDGSDSSQAVPLVIQVGIPPTVIIASPNEGDTFRAGDTIFYTASGNDGAGFDLHDSAFTTEIIFHHDTHTHPFIGPLPGNKTGQFTIPIEGEHASNIWYRINITATDTNGLSTIESVNIFPQKVNYTLQTQPAGLSLTIDGTPHTTPLTNEGIIGFHREILAHSPQLFNGDAYEFAGWSDGAPQKRTLTIPETPQTYTAIYQPANYYQAEFWNLNGPLSDPAIPNRTPDLTRQDLTINNNWGDAAPYPEINDNYFITRWTKTANFPSGTYRFTATADDGIRVYIDDQLVIDEWRLQGTTTFTKNQAITAGGHTIRVEYFDNTGGAYAQFNYQQISSDITPTPTPTDSPSPTPTPETTTYNAQFWNLTEAHPFPPIIPATSPDLTRQDTEVQFNWGGASPATEIQPDKFVARWNKQISQGGTYRFNLVADDGVRVIANGQTIIDQWQNQPPSAYTAEATMPNNWNLTIEYFENTGGAVMELDYQLISIVTPTPTLEPTPTPTDQPTPTPTSSAAYSGQYWNLPLDTPYPPQIPTSAPDLTREDPQILFNWGQGSPSPLIQSDLFIARWTKTIAQGGTYKFNVVTDDGIRIYANNELILDQWQGQPPTAYTVEKILPDNSDIRVEYYELYGGAVIELNYQLVTTPTLTPTDEPTPTPTDEPTPTPTGSDTYSGKYWNLPLDTPYPPQIPSSAPDLTREDAQILFNWNEGSPDPLIQSDLFAASWTKTIVQGGVYKFDVLTDDGIRIYANNELILDQWAGQPPTAYTVEKTLPDNSVIRIEYFELYEGAVIEFNYQNISAATPTPTQNSTPTPTSEPTYKAEFWNFPSNATLPASLPTTAPILTRQDSQILFNWGTGSPASGINIDRFGARWTRNVYFPAGSYRLTTAANDATRVYIDDQLVIDRWRTGTLDRFNTTVNITEGMHNIRVEFYEHRNSARMEFSWIRL